ncbi:MAG: multiheme c-type cytochrome, partial [Phycisphaeraceae bacterium]
SASASASSEADQAVGWILGNNGAVEYQDPQHADPFYHALLDLLAATAGTPAESADEAAQFRATVREEVWQTVLDGGPLSPFTLGCLKCHNITGNEIQWESRQVAFQHPASAFSNDDPHIVLNSHEALRQGQQCVICHTPSEADPDTAGDELADRLDFKPLDRASCATCHNAVGARESCLTCHSYHH